MKEIDLDHIVLDTIPMANPSVVNRDTPDDGIVLVNCDTGGALALNLTGKIVWTLIDGKRDLDAIVRSVSEKFSDVPKSVKDDVISLISLLAEEGFVGYELVENTV